MQRLVDHGICDLWPQARLEDYCYPGTTWLGQWEQCLQAPPRKAFLCRAGSPWGWGTQIHHCATCMCAHAWPSYLQEASSTTCYEDVCVAGWLGPSILMGGVC